MQGFSLIIWLGPIVILLAGLFILRTVARQWSAAKPVTAGDDSSGHDDLDSLGDLDTLSEDERSRYRRMLHRELDAEEGLGGLLGKEGV